MMYDRVQGNVAACQAMTVAAYMDKDWSGVSLGHANHTSFMDTGLGEINLALTPMPLKIGETSIDANLHDYVSLYNLGSFIRKPPGHGDHDAFKLYERIAGLPWMREKLERDRTSANYQGNPLWPTHVLKKMPYLASYFGLIDATDDKRCCIPGHQAINMRLGALLEAGLDTAWSFAAYQDEQPFSDRAYVDAFVRNRTLPCAAEDTRDFLHDWSYHFISLLLPKFLEGVRLNVEILLYLAKKITIPTLTYWNIYGHSEDERGQTKSLKIEEELAYHDAIARRIAIEIDVLTARPVQALMEILEGRPENARRIARFCGLFLSPPTQSSLRQLLPEIGLVIDSKNSDLAESPVTEISFVDFASHTLVELDAKLAHLEAYRKWHVPHDTMPALFAKIDLLR